MALQLRLLRWRLLLWRLRLLRLTARRGQLWLHFGHKKVDQFRLGLQRTHQHLSRVSVGEQARATVAQLLQESSQ